SRTHPTARQRLAPASRSEGRGPTERQTRSPSPLFFARGPALYFAAIVPGVVVQKFATSSPRVLHANSEPNDTRTLSLLVSCKAEVGTRRVLLSRATFDFGNLAADEISTTAL